jgi:hypothetical protein
MVADHYFGAGCAQCRRALIFAMNHRAHRQAAPAKLFHHCASDSAHTSGGAGKEAWALNRHAFRTQAAAVVAHGPIPAKRVGVIRVM